MRSGNRSASATQRRFRFVKWSRARQAIRGPVEYAASRVPHVVENVALPGAFFIGERRPRHSGFFPQFTFVQYSLTKPICFRFRPLLACRFADTLPRNAFLRARGLAEPGAPNPGAEPSAPKPVRRTQRAEAGLVKKLCAHAASGVYCREGVGGLPGPRFSKRRGISHGW